MDSATATQTAIEGLSICIAAAKVIKANIETIKHINKDLLEFAKEIDRCRNTLEILRILAREATHTVARDLLVDLDEQSLERTLAELKELTTRVATTRQQHGALRAGVLMISIKDDMKALTVTLRAQKDNIMNVVLLINTFASLRTVSGLEQMKETAVKQTTAPAFANDIAAISTTTSGPRLWLGNICTDDYPEEYNIARMKLADAAYDGRWDNVFELLDTALEDYNQNWVNAIRIKPREECDRISHWTVLHQAAFWRAPIDVVESLISRGAFRTLRTHKPEFTYPNQTAVELAKEFEFDELVPILAPAILSTIPGMVLAKLQRRFHEIIRNELGTLVDYFYLPELEVLTEIKDEAIWFEVYGYHYVKAGYLFRFDGRDLLVQSHGIRAEGEWQSYRITVEGVRENEEAQIVEVEQPLLINDYDQA